MPRHFLSCALAALLAGCGGLSASYQSAAPSTRPARASAAVNVYTLPPSRPYTVVGYLRVRQGGWSTAPGPEMLTTLRDEAARRGCDAVVLDHGYCVEEPERYSLRSATSSLLVAYCVDMTGAR